MTEKEVYYTEKIKVLQNILYDAEMDCKVLARTLFLEIEDPTLRGEAFTSRLTVQKIKLIKDLSIICEKISKTEF